MTEFRISYRVNRGRAAGWYAGADVGEATAKLRESVPAAYRGTLSIVSVSKRCGAPTQAGGLPRAESVFRKDGSCRRLTTLNRCPQHRDG